MLAAAQGRALARSQRELAVASFWSNGRQRPGPALRRASGNSKGRGSVRTPGRRARTGAVWLGVGWIGASGVGGPSSSRG